LVRSRASKARHDVEGIESIESIEGIEGIEVEWLKTKLPGLLFKGSGCNPSIHDKLHVETHKRA
jgi:hypothetical protein